MLESGHIGHEASDGTLLRHFCAGSEAAATQLHQRYAKRLLALVRSNRSTEMGARIDAEDIVQSVFRCFFQAARKGQYEIPQGEELWRIFLVIALNKVRNQRAFHRAAKRDVRLTSSGCAYERSLEETESEAAASQLLEIVVRDALGALEPQHRRMVEMRIEGFEISQIAEATNRSKRTIERVLQESRKQLYAIFHDDR